MTHLLLFVGFPSKPLLCCFTLFLFFLNCLTFLHLPSPLSPLLSFSVLIIHSSFFLPSSASGVYPRVLTLWLTKRIRPWTLFWNDTRWPFRLVKLTTSPCVDVRLILWLEVSGLGKRKTYQFIICGIQANLSSVFAYISMIFQWLIITTLAAVNPPNTVSWLIFHHSRAHSNLRSTRWMYTSVKPIVACAWPRQTKT